MRFTAAMLLASLSMAAYADSYQALTAEGAALIPPFQQQLLATVKSAMQSGGPAEAVRAVSYRLRRLPASTAKARGGLGVRL